MANYTTGRPSTQTMTVNPRKPKQHQKFSINGDKPPSRIPANNAIDPEKRRAVEEHQAAIRERDYDYQFDVREGPYVTRRLEGRNY